MNDSSDNYDRMPIERVDVILGQLWPEYWTPERLRGASPSVKREAVRIAFTGRGERRVRAARKNTRPARRAATYPLSNTVSSEYAPSRSDMMSDLPPTGLILGGERTMRLSMNPNQGAGYH